MPVSAYSSNTNRLYIFNFLISIHFVSGVLVPFFTIWGNITYVQIMFLQSFFVISIFMMEVPTGAVADKLGRKTSIILAAILFAVAALVYSSIPNFYVFMLGEFLWAVGSALLSGADEALLYDGLKADGKECESKRIFGRMTSAALLALMISAPIGSYIAASIGLRYSMMFLFMPCLLAAAVAMGLKEPEYRRAEDEQSYLDTIRNGFSYFRGHKILRILALDAILTGNFAFMIIWLYQPFLGELGVPILYFGFVHSGLTLAEIFFLNNFVRFERIIGSKRGYLALSALLPGVCYLVMSISDYFPLVLVMVLLISGLGISRGTLYQSYLNKHIESSNRATILSTISMLRQLLRAITYPIFGLFMEWSIRNTLAIVGIGLIIVTLLSRVREEYLIE